jgi:effector-binding domain-containing protein
MFGEPKLEERPRRPYIAIATTADMNGLGPAIGSLAGEVFEWLRSHAVAPAGPPFVRYITIDMLQRLDIEVGVPVAAPQSGDERVSADVLPAGNYATLLHVGPYPELMAATEHLLTWAANKGIRWTKRTEPDGERWNARLEFYLTDPQEEPDPQRYETELAFLTED